MAEHIPVPVEVAAKISEDFSKDIVVILAWQESSGLIHNTNFGKSAECKIAAAKMGDVLTAAMGCNLADSVTWEDFRVKPAAVAKEQMDRAIKLLKSTLERKKPIDFDTYSKEAVAFIEEVEKSNHVEFVGGPTDPTRDTRTSGSCHEWQR